MSTACKELASVHELSKRLLGLEQTPTLYEDNKAAIKLAITEESQTLRHVVNLCYHFVRQQAKAGEIKIEWIRSEEQLGDMFTKALPAPKLVQFRDSFMCNVDMFQLAGNNQEDPNPNANLGRKCTNQEQEIRQNHTTGIKRQRINVIG